jgi:hypothetical protein
MSAIPTMCIVNPHGDGFVRINCSDFDPVVHTRFVPPLADAPPPGTAGAAAGSILSDSEADDMAKGFGGKQAAPFKSGGGRDDKHPNTAKGKPRKG